LNGAGEFAIGGPKGDNGLSGKKLVIDHYGPGVPIGGGALAGKDPHKVDKCGALRARQWAKKLVRQGVDEAQEILGWAPGGDAPFLVEASTSQGGVNLQVPSDELPTEIVDHQVDRPRPGTRGTRLVRRPAGRLLLPIPGPLGAVRHI
jgi:S-adenosylmethionine synthetase